jgi:hypothetical protein
MKPKWFWSWTIFSGFLVMMLGALLSVIPIVGIVLLYLGIIIMIAGAIFLIPILIRERSRDYEAMRDEITEKELRP